MNGADNVFWDNYSVCEVKICEEVTVQGEQSHIQRDHAATDKAFKFGISSVHQIHEPPRKQMLKPNSQKWILTQNAGGRGRLFREIAGMRRDKNEQDYQQDWAFEIVRRVLI